MSNKATPTGVRPAMAPSNKVIKRPAFMMKRKRRFTLSAFPRYVRYQRGNPPGHANSSNTWRDAAVSGDHKSQSTYINIRLGYAVLLPEVPSFGIITGISNNVGSVNSVVATRPLR